jgi:hypothetical protein
MYFIVVSISGLPRHECAAISMTREQDVNRHRPEFFAYHSAVIPGRRATASPESMNTGP